MDTAATTADITWDEPTGITRPIALYGVEIARVPNGNAQLVWSPYDTTTEEGTTVRFLQPATEYQVRVLAMNAFSGFGAFGFFKPQISAFSTSLLHSLKSSARPSHKGE